MLSWASAPERVDAPPPPHGDQPPSRRLAPGAKWAWRLHLIGIWIALGVLASVLVSVDDVARTVFFAGSVLVFIPALVLLPMLRYRRWRCRIGSSISDRAIVCRNGERRIVARASGD